MNKKAILIASCAIGAGVGILGSKLIRKCVNKVTENKPDDEKKEVENTVAKNLIIAGSIATTYALVSIIANIDSRINAINNNTELCMLTMILGSDNTNSEKIEILKLAKDKFTSKKILERIDEVIIELMGGE